MKFAKGQSGNPGGRPKKLDGLAEMILEKTGDGKALVTRLIEIAQTGDDKDSVSAMKLLFEYGFGKPKEHVEHSADESLAGILSAMMGPKA